VYFDYSARGSEGCICSWEVPKPVMYLLCNNGCGSAVDLGGIERSSGEGVGIRTGLSPATSTPRLWVIPQASTLVHDSPSQGRMDMTVRDWKR
jgi:hypothetical protein